MLPERTSADQMTDARRTGRPGTRHAVGATWGQAWRFPLKFR
jgi:hypothetical protein